MNAKVTEIKMAAGAEIRSFSIDEAESLLRWRNWKGEGSGWTLADPDWEWNGTALVKKVAPKKKEKDS